MRLFFVIVSVVFGLLLQADVAQAACANGVEQPSIASVSPGHVAADAQVSHDSHVPCSDATHLHVSCVCVGQFFVPVSALAVPDFSHTVVRFELTNAMLIGRKLQPPVPPPL